MANYKIEIAKSAEKSLYKIPKAYLVKIIDALKALATNPYPSGCKKLTGEEQTYRIRVGSYRIIYEIFDNLILIKVLKIGHRKDVYR